MQISGVNKNILFMQFNQLALLAKMFLATVSVRGKIFLIISNLNFFYTSLSLSVCVYLVVVGSSIAEGADVSLNISAQPLWTQYYKITTAISGVSVYKDIFRRDSELVVSRDMLYETLSISKTYFKTTLAPFRLNIQKCCYLIL